MLDVHEMTQDQICKCHGVSVVLPMPQVKYQIKTKIVYKIVVLDKYRRKCGRSRFQVNHNNQLVEMLKLIRKSDPKLIILTKMYQTKTLVTSVTKQEMNKYNHNK